MEYRYVAYVFNSQFLLSSPATSDYTATTGEVTITEDAPFQCVSIPIRYDSVTELTECFTFEISSAATVSGLTVDPSETQICIVDRNCELFPSTCK